MADPIFIEVSTDERPDRLDRFLARKLKDRYSRTALQRWIREAHVRVNGASVKSHYEIQPGDRIEITPTARPECACQPENIPVEVLYEDEDVLVINKPAGMVVHPGAGNRQGTLVNALLFRSKELSSGSGENRPGIVHRLDKDTSGLLVVARNDWTHERLSRQFKEREAGRMYVCVVKGVVQHDEGCYEERIGKSVTDLRKMRIDPVEGKPAITYFTVEKRFRAFTLLRVKLMTGRTHQIRVHMAHHGHPIVGDLEYGVSSPFIKRQALHAGSLSFVHPRKEKELSFEAPLPEDMQILLRCLDEADKR